jgi:uncharacterized SAM-binding protein YcdF (DUF218 family)
MNRAHISPGRVRQRRERGGILLRILFWMGILAVLGVLYLLREPILRLTGEILIVEQDPTEADAIFLLGDDNYSADRATRAAELYHARWAPRIVASGRYLRPYVSIADLMQRDLTERGVPAAAVLRLPSYAQNTRQEANVLLRVTQEKKWKRVLVVTSNYHSRRARRIFDRVFDGAAEVRLIPARDGTYDPQSWWRTRLGVKHFFGEAVSFFVALWETRSTERAREGPLPSGELRPAAAQ